MRKHGIGSRFLVLLLVLAMVLPLVPMQAEAASVGTMANVDTGLVNNTIDTEDTISLPIRIMDYENDGMLFEYAESKETKKPADFGATWAADFTTMEVGASISNSLYGNFTWTSGSGASVNKSIVKSNNYANYLHSVWRYNKASNGGSFYGRSTVITPNDLGGLAMNNVRYLVMVYKSNVTSGKIGFWVERTGATTRTDGNNRTGDLTFTSLGANTWTYAVYDLKQGKLGETWTSYGNANCVFVTMPMDASGEYIDIAHVALFANKDQATAFGEYALTDGSDRGDNRAFGLLRGSRTETDDGNADNGYGSAFAGIHKYVNTGAKYGAAKDTIYQVPWSSSSTLDVSTVTKLGYTLLGTYGIKNIANIGLLESTLSEDGYPVYKEEVVTYLAYLLQHSLEIPERTEDGWKNYRYVKGTPSPIYGNVDLATALRSRIQERIGSYDEAASKGLVGTWTECEGKIASYYDAAYFLLNSIFVPNSYNEPQDNNTATHYYDYLVLSAGYDSKTVTDENPTGDKVYVFDGGFSDSSDPNTANSAVKYDDTNHTIQNTDAAGKAHFYYITSDTTTLDPFLPVRDDNTASGMTKNPYYQDDGIINGVKKQTDKDTNYQRDYNFVMVSSGEFVYHADDELFFEFEGDDDVYLFINKELVMDIGSAHSIDSVRFELNDYVEKAKAGELGSDERNKRLALIEGDTYSFDFFYMERHSYGSNMRINTNIHITDPSMTTEKTAYVDGTKVEYGGIVNASSIVEYGFSITNAGGENLYNIGFTDNDIGVKLDPDNGLTITGDRVYSLDGTLLRKNNTEDRDKLVKELTAVLTGKDQHTGEPVAPITVTFADNDALKFFLHNITSDQALESGGGLWKGSTVLFRGIGYKLSEAQAQSGWFDNTVYSTSTNLTKSKTLKSQATMRVCVPSDPMYYQWANHKLEISLEKLIDDINAAANQEGNALSGKVSQLTAEGVTNIVELTKGGYGYDYPQVAVNSDFSLAVNYTTVGSYVFYVKIYYKITETNWPNVIVPIVVNVTDVAPSVFVLDYGLEAELTGKNNKGITELLKNDTLSVPGRPTDYSFQAIADAETFGYTPNEVYIQSGKNTDADGVIESGSGTFKLGDKKLSYLPTDFMETTDTIEMAVSVYESNITPSEINNKTDLDINNEVQMYKTVTVLPATVVYYEDDFPAITYYDENTANVFTPVGSSSGNSQGVDQDENYGHDNSYTNDDAYSGDSLTRITVKENGLVARFTFKGTGFELISRTNARDSATIYMAVFDESVDAANITYKAGRYYNGETEITPIRNIPVITEFDNAANGGAEEIYQVPVIRVDDLELGAYTVVIRGVPAYDWSVNPATVIPTILYVDGLRIFQPMGVTNDNYTADENGAVFTEIRDLIVSGKAAVATYSGSAVTVSTGTTTWTENRNGVYNDGSIYEGNMVNSVNDYLIYGPNNEVYMDGAFSDTALAFQVTESGTGTHALQIAIHAVDQGLFYGAESTDMNAPVYYAVVTGKDADGNNTYGWKLLDTITSGVEMYYTIDYTKCPKVNGVYQIILKVDIGEDYNTAMASYTTIKTVGLEIGSISGTGEVTDLTFVDGVLTDTATGAAVDPASYPAFKLLSRMLSTSVVMAAPEQPVPVNPFVDAEEDAYYYDAMLWAVENGITSGTTATTFSPAASCTRAQVVTFLWAAQGRPEPTTTENPFVDVTESDYFYKPVLWAVENGITSGVDANSFAPENECVREQVVTFLWAVENKPGSSAAVSFSDVQTGTWYYNAVAWAVENGVTSGVGNGRFGVGETCTRAQVVTFLYQAQ